MHRIVKNLALPLSNWRRLFVGWKK